MNQIEILDASECSLTLKITPSQPLTIDYMNYGGERMRAEGWGGLGCAWGWARRSYLDL